MDNKCEHCKKKSFVLFDCKCKKHFCTYHRLPEKHNCVQIYEIQRLQYSLNENKLMRESVKPSSFVKLE